MSANQPLRTFSLRDMAGEMRARVLWPPVIFAMGALGLATGLDASIFGVDHALAELPIRAAAVTILALLWMRRLHRLNVG